MSFDLSTYNTTRSRQKKLAAGHSFAIRKRYSDKKKEMFYRELSMLLKSGVDFKKALEIMGKQAKTKSEKELIIGIKDKVVEGKSICDAMIASSQFSPYEYYSVQIGEETRRLEAVLAELQKYFNRRIQMRRQIISVLTYPVIVLIVTFLVLYFMLTKVVPMFNSVFRQFGSELPKSTRIIIQLSNNSGLIFTCIAIFLVAMATIHYYFKNTGPYRDITARITSKIPYFGPLIKKIYISRFCQSMNLLITSKTTLLSALSLTSKMIGYYPIEHSIETIKGDITKGASLSESLRKHSVYDDKMVSMIEVAEQVNQLDEMFERLTEQYNEEISHQTKMIGVVLEPAIIIVIGLIVGVIMISMYAPMFDLSKIMSK